MYNRFVLVGIADDGPDGVVTPLISQDHLTKLFGWNRLEVHNVAAAASSLTPNASIWGYNFDIWQVSGDAAIKHDLFEPQVLSTTSIGFTSLAVSGSYLISYTPDQPENGLILGALDHFNTSEFWPSVLRIPGTPSSVEINGYTFSGRYSGNRYDGITVAVSGSTVTITDPNTVPQVVRTYTLTDSSNFLSSINGDALLGLCPVLVSGPSSETPSLIDGTYTLSGGANGVVTSEAVTGVLDGIDLDEVGYIVLCGGVPSGVIEDVVSYLDSTGYDLPYLIAGEQISVSGTIHLDPDPADAYSVRLSTWPVNSDRLFYVPGWANMPTLGTPYRWASPVCVFSGLMETAIPVHKVAPILETFPIWTKSQLATLKSKFCPMNKYISSGLGFASGIVTSGVGFAAVYLKEYITRRTIPILESYIGQQPPSADEVSTRISAALQDAPYTKDMDLTVRVGIDYMEASITAEVFGEVKSIELTIATRR